jgi:hypothetical protein
MKLQPFWGLPLLLLLVASPGIAQEPTDLETLQRQLTVLQEQLGQSQQDNQRLAAALQALQQQMHKLQQDAAPAPALDRPEPDPAPPPPAAPVEAEIESLKRQLEQLTEASKRTFPSQFNPSIGFAGEIVFGYRSEDSDRTGSDRPGGFDAHLRTAEIGFQASVDPFARAYAVINASADLEGNATVGLEEAAILTTSLPAGLSVRGGRFFAEFGRLSYRHEHDLPFVHRPLALESYVGGESLSDGLELNWLLPTLQYISWTAGVGTQFGPLAVNPGPHRDLNELNVWSRLGTYFDLNPNLNLELGVSGMFNDQADDRGQGFTLPDGSILAERRRGLAGADITVRYQPLAGNLHRNLEWGTEVLFNTAAFDSTLEEATTRDQVDAWGLYSYVAHRFSRRWTVGFLFDYAQNHTYSADHTFRYSPYLTLQPSEFQKLRLQYSYTDPKDSFDILRPDHAVYLQWEFILGFHAHGFRQR